MFAYNCKLESSPINVSAERELQCAWKSFSFPLVPWSDTPFIAKNKGFFPGTNTCVLTPVTHYLILPHPVFH